MGIFAVSLLLLHGPAAFAQTQQQAQQSAQGEAQPPAVCWLVGSAISVTLDPSTQWQPRKGRVRLIARSSQDIKSLGQKARMGFLPANTTLPDNQPALNELPADVVVESAKVGEVVYLVEVPALDRQENVRTDFLWLIPLTRLTLTLTDPANEQCTHEYRVEIGITDPWFAAGGVLVLLVILYFGARFFKNQAGRPETGTLLFPLETSERRASLSQFQILFWSIIVGSSAIYVMMLSGNLIEITSGTLILLGIVGGASVLSAWQSERESNPNWKPRRQKLFQDEPKLLVDGAPAPAAPGQGATPPDPRELAVDGDFYLDSKSRQMFELVEGEWKALEIMPERMVRDKDLASLAADDPPMVTLTALGRTRLRDYLRRPRWRHLFEAKPGEVDPARLQMLLFTAVTGVFVMLTVVRNYVIPEIPEGYLVLMGISNGVYLGGKFVKAGS